MYDKIKLESRIAFCSEVSLPDFVCGFATSKEKINEWLNAPK